MIGEAYGLFGALTMLAIVLLSNECRGFVFRQVKQLRRVAPTDNPNSSPRRQRPPGDAPAGLANIDQRQACARPSLAHRFCHDEGRPGTPYHNEPDRPPDRLRDDDDGAGHRSSGSPKPITFGPVPSPLRPRPQPRTARSAAA
jgi:hypothetical protein